MSYEDVRLSGAVADLKLGTGPVVHLALTIEHNLHRQCAAQSFPEDLHVTATLTCCTAPNAVKCPEATNLGTQQPVCKLEASALP